MVVLPMRVSDASKYLKIFMHVIYIMKTRRDLAFTDFELLDWKLLFNETIQYLIVGEETCPETHRCHYQGFIQYKEDINLKYFKDNISNITHIEWRRGTVQQNIDYCKKSNTYQEYGEPDYGFQERRNDLTDIYNDIYINNLTLSQIAMEYPNQWIRYSNGIKSLWHINMQNRATDWRDIVTTVYVGESAAGKTRLVIEKTKKNLFIVNCENKTEFLFDGYKGESSILFDDFYGQIKYHYMLRILDGYRLPLNIKNGRTMALWDQIYITSNKTPALWYSSGLKSLKRRINLVYEVIEGNTSLLSLNCKKNYESDDDISD